MHRPSETRTPSPVFTGLSCYSDRRILRAALAWSPGWGAYPFLSRFKHFAVKMDLLKSARNADGRPGDADWLVVRLHPTSFRGLDVDPTPAVEFLVRGLSHFVLLPSGFTEKPWEEWTVPLTFTATDDTATPNPLVTAV
jgi:hypothetical protein